MNTADSHIAESQLTTQKAHASIKNGNLLIPSSFLVTIGVFQNGFSSRKFTKAASRTQQSPGGLKFKAQRFQLKVGNTDKTALLFQRGKSFNESTGKGSITEVVPCRAEPLQRTPTSSTHAL